MLERSALVNRDRDREKDDFLFIEIIRWYFTLELEQTELIKSSYFHCVCDLDNFFLGCGIFFLPNNIKSNSKKENKVI